MQYYKELTVEQQKQVLDNLQDLPLFVSFRDNAHAMLIQSEVHLFDKTLGMHTLSSPSTERICHDNNIVKDCR